MKKNEARPFFRILAGGASLLFWFVFILTSYASIKHGFTEHRDLKLSLTMLVGATGFTYIAVAGYMPKFILSLFSRGPVARDEDLK